MGALMLIHMALTTRRARAVLLSVGIAVAATLVTATQAPVRIAGFRSGSAELIQQGRLTVLEFSSQRGKTQHIALTHPSEYQQGTNAPYKARTIGESPQHFLIFTDSFDSNPGDAQGQCGASPTGERFVHVVALGAIPHETLSTLFDSCLLDIESAPTSPEWVAKRDSAGFVGKLVLRFESGKQPSIVYYVAPDGAVTRPQVLSNH